MEKETFRIPMILLSQNPEFQCLEMVNFAFPMLGIAKIRNSNVWKRQNSQLQCLEKEKSRIQCLELPKFLILMFGKAKIHYSTFWKSR